MVKTTGPLLSAAAAGTIGNLITHQSSGGRSIARKRPVPSQPQTPPQLAVRAAVKALSEAWSQLTGLDRFEWDTDPLAVGTSGYHAYMKYNCNRWRNFQGFNQRPYEGHPGYAPTIDGDWSSVKQLRNVVLTMPILSMVQGWMWIVYRTDTTPWVPAWSDAIAFINLNAGATTYTWSDQNPGVGTWYYKTQFITMFGGRQSRTTTTLSATFP